MTTNPHRAAQVRPGDRLSERRCTVTRSDLRRFSLAAGDLNPIHLSDEVARAVGLPGIICHGMIIMAGALQIVESWLVESEEIVSASVHFAVPLPVPPGPGVELIFRGRVTAVENGVASIALQAESGDVPLLVGSTAQVRLSAW